MPNIKVVTVLIFCSLALAYADIGMAKTAENQKIIQNKLKNSGGQTLKQALKEREVLEQKIQNNFKASDAQKWLRTPKRSHLNGIRSSGSGRLLDSTNNQFSSIDEGNTDQAFDSSFLYTLKGQNITIQRLNGLTLSTIYTKTFNLSTDGYPSEVFSSNGYFAVISQRYQTSTAVVVNVFKNNNGTVSLLKTYAKSGTYVQAKQYNNYLLVVTQEQMTSSSLNYNWTVSGVGIVNATIFEGVSANSSSNNTGNVARSLARIPLNQNVDFKFATYLMTDYTFDLIMSSNLNIFIAGNYYTPNAYAVSVQYLKFNSGVGQVWGSSQWIVLSGIILNNYQMQDYNGYFRTTTDYNSNSTQYDILNVVKVPLQNFTKAAATVWTNLTQTSTQGVARWRNDIVFLIYDPTHIITFSTSIGAITGSIETTLANYFLYPYFSKYMIGFGASRDGLHAAVSLFQFSSFQLIQKQTVQLTANITPTSYNMSYVYSLYGWFSAPFLQIDQINKRLTFPVYTSEEEPYKAGYFQLYIDPETQCMSSFPVPANCGYVANQTTPVYAHVFKHWDQTSTQGYKNATGMEIRRSTTLNQNGQTVLVTTSECQMQARKLLPINQTPALQPNANSVSQVKVLDLCL